MAVLCADSVIVCMSQKHGWSSLVHSQLGNSLPILDEVGRIDQNREVRSTADLINLVDFLIGPLLPVCRCQG